MANNLNKENLCSNLNTKNELTTYAEGLSCKLLDKRTLYNIRRYGAAIWWILNKEAGTKSPCFVE